MYVASDSTNNLYNIPPVSDENRLCIYAWVIDQEEPSKYSHPCYMGLCPSTIMWGCDNLPTLAHLRKENWTVPCVSRILFNHSVTGKVIPCRVLNMFCKMFNKSGEQDSQSCPHWLYMRYDRAMANSCYIVLTCAQNNVSQVDLGSIRAHLILGTGAHINLYISHISYAFNPFSRFKHIFRVLQLYFVCVWVRE